MLYPSIHKVFSKDMAVIMGLMLLFTVLPFGAILAGDVEESDATVEAVEISGHGGEDTVGIPANVEAYAGNRKIALRWTDPDFGSASAYEIQMNNGPWIEYSTGSLTFDPAVGKWVQLFGGLMSELEYTFRIRAIDSAGSPGPYAEVKAQPTTIWVHYPMGADLVSIHGVTVMPDDGWQVDTRTYEGLSIVRPFELTMELATTYNHSAILRDRIFATPDAMIHMYDHYDWRNEVAHIDRLDADLEWKEEVHVYLKVVSGDVINERYYDVTVKIPDTQ